MCHQENGDVWVHYPEGSRNWREVQHRPVWCSLAEARAYCRSQSCRILTEGEYSLAVAFDPCGARFDPGLPLLLMRFLYSSFFRRISITCLFMKTS